MKSESLRRVAFATTATLLLHFAAATHAADAKPPTDTGTAPANANRVPSLDELFATLDKNHDDKISKDEATGEYAQRFSQWDADGDGFATRQEIHDFRTRLGIDDSGRRIAAAQQRTSASATILKEPADWRLEMMSVPAGFAPDVKLRGSEEIRFAPGMFDNTSATYFTCVLAIVADGAPDIGAAEIHDFLEKYYRGLSTGRAQRTGTKPDPAAMKAVVNPSTGTDAKNRFDAQVDFFDSFSDGRKITLNVEAQVLALPATKQTCLLLLVSPSAKDSAAWQTLRGIGKRTALNLSAPNADADALRLLEQSVATPK